MIAIQKRLLPWALPVLLLSIWQLSAQLGWLSIRILPAPLEFPTMQIFVQWHSRLGDDEGARWFRSKIVDVVARLDG